MESLGYDANAKNKNKTKKGSKNTENFEEDKLSTSEESAFGRQLTNLELIRKAEHYTDTLKLEKAVSLYEEGLQRFPNDTQLLDAYTDLLIQLGEEVKAKKVSIIPRLNVIASRKVHLAKP